MPIETGVKIDLIEVAKLFYPQIGIATKIILVPTRTDQLVRLPAGRYNFSINPPLLERADSEPPDMKVVDVEFTHEVGNYKFGYSKEMDIFIFAELTDANIAYHDFEK